MPKDSVESIETTIIDPYEIHLVDLLDAPVKSEYDQKEYRTIKLENGLTALLISDFKYIKNKDTKNAEPIEKMAACGLCVNVGSFSDPLQVQGLAHYLEHVVTMGSNKYPAENEYQQFIKEKGGSLHAETGYEKTMYIFQIHPDYLLAAMDRFANIFVSPLLKRKAVLRERESIDNEFYLDLSSDYERLKQFFHTIPIYNHPASKFSCGNSISLNENANENTLYSELKEFRKRHYSAHRMKLVVQATLPLNTLEEYVAQCFSSVPSNYLPPSDFSDFVGPKTFYSKRFNKIYKIKTIQNTCEMELKWVLPPSRHLYKVKPLNYLTWIINNEGKHSLSYCLRKNKLCNRVSISSEEYEIYSVIKLNFVLSSIEQTLIKEILDIVFSYFNMLRSEGPQKWIFDEIQAVAAYKFRFKEELNAASNIQDLCCDMHFYPPADYLTGGSLYFEYDPKCIQSYLDCLVPENFYIVLIDKNFDEKNFDKIEPWYRIKYAKKKIPEEWIADWRENKLTTKFRLPESNPFIATSFRLIDVPFLILENPKKIKYDDKIEIWYKPDYKYRLPKCYVYLHLISANRFQQSINTCIMLRLFEILLHEMLLENLYEAKCTGLAYNVFGKDDGIIVKVNGFHQNLPYLLKLLMDHIAKFVKTVTEDMFDFVKTELSKYYSSVLYDPGNLASQIASSILETNFWMATEKQAALSDIKFEQFIDFMKKLTNKVFIRCLVQGNVNENKARKMIIESIESLWIHSQYDTLIRDKITENENDSLMRLGKKNCRVRNFNPSDVNSVVINYYQTDAEMSKFSLPVFKEFLEMLMQESLFYQLRTTEQLGYSVSCSYTLGGFNIIIYSPIHKFTTEFVNKRIDTFVKNFIDKLKEMSEDEFNTKKEIFNKIKKCDISLNEEVERNWFAIRTQNFIFDERNEEISIINSFTAKDFHQWINDSFMSDNKFRKLSVQVVGNINSSDFP